MGQLYEQIRQAVLDGEYLIGRHAAERLDERAIEDWQIIGAVEDAKLICERHDASPNPAIELQATLPDGTPVKAVWSWLPVSRVAKLVTVHYFDE